MFDLRPDDVFLSGHGLTSAAPHEETVLVSLTEPLGNETLVFFDFAGQEWVSRMLDPRPLSAGEPVRMRFDLAKAHLFSAANGRVLAREAA